MTPCTGHFRATRHGRIVSGLRLALGALGAVVGDDGVTGSLSP
ncbi:MAG: hypothetical protein R3E83_16350 [Burkholderiaceae bacterium]